MNDAKSTHDAASTARTQSMTDGRIGTGKNAGVRNVSDGKSNPSVSRAKSAGYAHDPDLRVGAKGTMHQDIGESICLQKGNDCKE